jgi:hypothetical protein
MRQAQGDHVLGFVVVANLRDGNAVPAVARQPHPQLVPDAAG